MMAMLLAGCALAEQSTVARNGSLAAYLDGEGHLYLPGNEKPINAAVAAGIDTYIANGRKSVLAPLLGGKSVGTFFPGSAL